MASLFRMTRVNAKHSRIWTFAKNIDPNVKPQTVTSNQGLEYFPQVFKLTIIDEINAISILPIYMDKMIDPSDLDDGKVYKA